jgi:hypothetical protein
VAWTSANGTSAKWRNAVPKFMLVVHLELPVVFPRTGES